MEDRILQFLKNHKIAIKGQNARSFIFDCPACGADHKFYVSKKDGLSVCFRGKTERCPRPGSKPVYALHVLSGLPIDAVRREIVDFIQDLTDDITVKFDEVEPIKQEDPLPTVMLPVDVTFMDDRLAEEGKNYLERRGIPLSLQKQYNVFYSPSMRRVIFTVIMDNKLYGWQGRAIDNVDHTYRMYNLPGPWKARSLMFYENLQNKEFAIIAEGPVSALKFHKVGGFVATMGKEVSRTQVDLICKSGVKKIYIAVDRDAVDKYNKIRQTVETINPAIECYQIDVPDNRDDFGDCTFDECETAFQSATKLDGEQLFSYIGLNYKF